MWMVPQAAMASLHTQNSTLSHCRIPKRQIREVIQTGSGSQILGPNDLFVGTKGFGKSPYTLAKP